jgi:hypothetical protein
MYRRRLAAFAGAIGLLGALFSSGVAARADTSISDAAFNTMVNSYVDMALGGQGVCLGVPQANDGTCPNTVQSSTDHNNVAVCVEHDTAVDESCVIDQTNITGHNIAIVVQIYNKNQDASQRADIIQRNVDGSNLAAIVQIVKQSTQSAGAQNDNQQASIAQNGNALPTDGGRNHAILHQSSNQFGQSGTMDPQSQNSIENGQVSQTRGGVSRAHADQSQSQTLKGLGPQTQSIDPRCCAFQRSNPNNDFAIAQSAIQFADRPVSQHSSTIGDCDSSGHCGIDQTASVNNNPALRQHTDCTGTSCSSGIVCSTSGCQSCTVSEGGCSIGGLARVALNLGPSNRPTHHLLTGWSSAARSGGTSTSRSATPALLT